VRPVLTLPPHAAPRAKAQDELNPKGRHRGCGVGALWGCRRHSPPREGRCISWWRPREPPAWSPPQDSAHRWPEATVTVAPVTVRLSPEQQAVRSSAGSTACMCTRPEDGEVRCHRRDGGTTLAHVCRARGCKPSPSQPEPATVPSAESERCTLTRLHCALTHCAVSTRQRNTSAICGRLNSRHPGV
jgi:hypothetical protein